MVFKGPHVFHRLVVVLLNARHEYGALDEVKTELSWLVAELKCPNFIGKSVPFLTDSSELGERNIIHSGKSEIYGEFSVEESDSRDVDNEEFTYRRLIFQNQPTLVQCQCRIAKKEETIKKGKKKQTVSLICVGFRLRQIGIFRSMRRDNEIVDFCGLCHKVGPLFSVIKGG